MDLKDLLDDSGSYNDRYITQMFHHTKFKTFESNDPKTTLILSI